MLENLSIVSPSCTNLLHVSPLLSANVLNLKSVSNFRDLVDFVKAYNGGGAV